MAIDLVMYLFILPSVLFSCSFHWKLGDTDKKFCIPIVRKPFYW